MAGIGGTGYGRTSGGGHDSGMAARIEASHRAAQARAPQAAARGGGGGTVRRNPGPVMPYQPNAPKVQQIIDPLKEAGTGLLDPNSQYAQQARKALRTDIGKSTAAAQRAAALRAAQGGMGAGASPELLETQGDISRAGEAAYGEAATDALLGGFKLGGELLSPALSGQLGISGQQLQAYLAQQAANQDAEAMEFQAQLAQQQLAQQAMLQQMAMAYGALG